MRRNVFVEVGTKIDSGGGTILPNNTRKTPSDFKSIGLEYIKAVRLQSRLCVWSQSMKSK